MSLSVKTGHDIYDTIAYTASFIIDNGLVLVIPVSM